MSMVVHGFMSILKAVLLGLGFSIRVPACNTASRRRSKCDPIAQYRHPLTLTHARTPFIANVQCRGYHHP